MKAAFDNNDDFANPFENTELLSVIKAEQNEAEQDDWREGVIEEYLNKRERTCLIEIWQRALYQDRSPNYPEMKRKDSNELVSIIVNKLGWQRGNVEVFDGFGKQKSYHNVKLQEEMQKELEQIEATLPF